MVSNATEMRHLMEFWAQSLDLTPAGSKATGNLYEVSAGMTPEMFKKMSHMGPAKLFDTLSCQCLCLLSL